MRADDRRAVDLCVCHFLRRKNGTQRLQWRHPPPRRSPRRMWAALHRALETNLRVAEFKFIDWKGGPELDFIQMRPSGRVTQGRKQSILYRGREFRTVPA